MKKFKTEKTSFKVPDSEKLVRDVEYVKVRKYEDYYKVNLCYGDKSWAVRFRTANDVVNYLTKGTKSFTKAGFDTWTINELGSKTYNSDITLDAVRNLSYEDETEKTANKCVAAKLAADECVADLDNEKCVAEYKEEKNMDFSMINGAITFDKKLAFNVNGKWKYVNEAGAVSEVLPQFVMVKNIPALVPTIADKITVGVYYSDGETLYKAIADNRVINLETGIIAEILISSIPMTDKVVVYKPLFGGDGKFNVKDLIQAQMLTKLDNGNPLMAAMLLGDGEFDLKTMALLNMTNGGKFDTNSFLPLMFLDDGKDTDIKDIFLMQALAGKGGDPMQNILLLKMLGDKKEKTSKKD